MFPALLLISDLNATWNKYLKDNFHFRFIGGINMLKILELRIWKKFVILYWICTVNPTTQLKMPWSHLHPGRHPNLHQRQNLNPNLHIHQEKNHLNHNRDPNQDLIHLHPSLMRQFHPNHQVHLLQLHPHLHLLRGMLDLPCLWLPGTHNHQ